MSGPNTPARLATMARWLRMTAVAGESATPAQLLSWADGLAQIGAELGAADLLRAATDPDPMIAYQRDRINAVEAEIVIDSIHKLVKFLGHHAAQAATVAELVEIDAAATALIDGMTLLGRGIARPNQPQNQTGA